MARRSGTISRRTINIRPPKVTGRRIIMNVAKAFELNTGPQPFPPEEGDSELEGQPMGLLLALTYKA